MSLPPRLAEIVEDFQLAEGREKLELLLHFSEQLPPLPDFLLGQSDQMDQVHECMTPIFVYAERDGDNLVYYFDAPPESPTVRGFAELMRQGLSGNPPETILAVPADFYLAMGLQSVLTGQRLNGIAAILAHMKRLATQQLTAS